MHKLFKMLTFDWQFYPEMVAWSNMKCISMSNIKLIIFDCGFFVTTAGRDHIGIIIIKLFLTIEEGLPQFLPHDKSSW